MLVYVDTIQQVKTTTFWRPLLFHAPPSAIAAPSTSFVLHINPRMSIADYMNYKHHARDYSSPFGLGVQRLTRISASAPSDEKILG